MTDRLLEALKTFLENNTVDNKTLTTYVIIISIIAILSIVINTIIQLILKRSESNESIRKIRSERRLDSTEKLYSNLCLLLLGLYDNTVYSGSGLEKYKQNIAKMRRWLSIYKIRIDNRIERKAIEVLDYIVDVLSDRTHRKITVEIQQLESIKKLYEAL